MKILRTANLADIVRFLESRTNDSFTVAEAKQFRWAWLHSEYWASNTDDMTDTELLNFLEEVGI